MTNLEVDGMAGAHALFHGVNQEVCVPVEVVELSDAVAREEGASHRAVEPGKIIVSMYILFSEPNWFWLTSTYRLLRAT